MADVSKNKWKYSTIGLLAILAVGFTFPNVFAAAPDNVLNVVKDIQAKINSDVFGLEVIKTAVDSKASQSDVAAIKDKTQNLPSDPASQSEIDSQLEGIQSDTDDIQSQLANLPADTNAAKAIVIKTTMNPPDGGVEALDIIPAEEGKFFYGHIVGSASFFFDDKTAGSFSCGNTPITAFELSDDLYDQNIRHVDKDFACSSLTVIAHDVSDGTDGGPGELWANVVYYETSDVTQVPAS